MEAERWQQIDRLFEAALGRPATERPAFLADVCAHDPELRAELESLLAAHDRQDGFLETPVVAAEIADTLNDEDPLVGNTLGGYHILRRLGQGGVGIVYLAEDTRLSRQVAVKLLARRSAVDADTVRRFRKEALAASALNHPNILTIHEIGDWRGRDFIVSEFVEGMTLRESMRNGPLPLDHAIDIAAQVAGALAAAHAAGIVHRDIKPENIMVRPDGLVKLLDFGIAKQTAPDAPSGSSSARLMVLGTVAYMSPEQARGDAVDGRTDVWSLGVLLYEMISGRPPFPGRTNSDRIAGILQSEPERLPAVDAASAKLAEIVERALAKDREARYHSAAELMQELRQARGELGRSGRPVWRTNRPLLYAAILLAIGAALPGARYVRTTLANRGAGRSAPAREAIHSLAVLPFANESGTRDSDYLADGLTDTLIDDLSRIDHLKVSSQTAVHRYRSAAVDVRQAARALGVRAVLTGRVVQHGQSLSVTVELVDATDDSHLWGENYDRKLADLVHVTKEIAGEVTEKLRLRLSSEQRSRLVRLHTNSPEAYQAYLRGRYYWLKRAFPSWLPGSAPDFAKSRDFFQQAVEADPGYALAYCGLGHYYAMAAGNALMRPQDGWPKAKAAFQKAMELDPGLPDLHAGLAVTLWVDRGDWAGAEKELQALPQTDPSIRSEALYARLLAAQGRFDEAIALARRATELDPLSTRFSAALGDILYYARRYDEAVRQYQRTLEIDPRDVWVHEALGNAYERVGARRQAIAEWSAALTYAGDRTAAAALDRAYHRSGWAPAVQSVARARLRHYEDLTRRGEFAPALEFARAYVRLGKREQALEWLTKAGEEHTVSLMFLNTDPFYDELRGDARFQAVACRLRRL